MILTQMRTLYSPHVEIHVQQSSVGSASIGKKGIDAHEQKHALAENNISVQSTLNYFPRLRVRTQKTQIEVECTLKFGIHHCCRQILFSSNCNTNTESF